MNSFECDVPQQKLSNYDPFVAILRGLPSAQALAACDIVLAAGFRTLEIPLTSEGAITSIEAVVRKHGEQALIGAGTVLTAQDVKDVHNAGGQLIVTPNVSEAVIRTAHSLGMVCVPGVCTPSEAFNALSFGATGLKLFPAEGASPAVLKAWRSVISEDTVILPTGGITPDSMRSWFEAGASGFGIGGALYRPGKKMDDLARDSQAFVTEWTSLKGGHDSNA